MKDPQNIRVEEDQNESRNIIGEGTFVYGNLETTGNIRLEGKMEGNIRSDLKVVLGKTAVITGNIIANEVEVEGKLEGSIEAKERLLLSSDSKVIGDIHSKTLLVKEGASLQGKCFINEELKTPD